MTVTGVRYVVNFGSSSDITQTCVKAPAGLRPALLRRVRRSAGLVRRPSGLPPIAGSLPRCRELEIWATIMGFRWRRHGDPTSSLPRSTTACMTYAAAEKKGRHVKTSDARRDRASGERGIGAQNRHRQARHDSYRGQMRKVRRTQSRLSRSRRGSGPVHVQGMRRETKDVLIRVTRTAAIYKTRGFVGPR
jgi:hypothetical protein